MKNNIYKRSLALAVILSLMGTIAYAETNGGTITGQQLLTTLIFTMIVMSVVALVLAGTILTLIRARNFEKVAAKEGLTVQEAREAAKPKVSWWKTLWEKRLNDFVPLEEEQSIDLGHDYDGIRELDNNLPPWWKYGFYFSIAFAFVYLIHFHVSEQSYLNWFFGKGISSTEEFQIAMDEAEEVHKAYLEKVANMVNETNVIALAEASDLSAGKAIYKAKNCQSCHRLDGGGSIGPNLTDEYWKHGGDVKDIFKTIKYGIPATAMIAWQKEIKPKEMQQLASYVLSLQGTKPANPKAPEGDLYVPIPQADSLGQTDTTSIAMN
ncbi:MAG: c-type cytochrome [Bacteroidia bacterium]|nr:c-type cytochrome [Bacteroidia bacterium]